MPFTAATLQLDHFTSFSEDVCCDHKFYSLVLLFNNMLGMLIAKHQAIFHAF